MFHRSGSPFREEHSLITIHDESQACPYIAGQEARMPLQWPMASITGEALDRYLDQGYRRSGPFLYQTRCRSCNACEPTRVDVDCFEMTRSFRRVLNRGDRELQLRVARPSVDENRVALFNQHRLQRGLGSMPRETDEREYAGFLVETICDTREITFWREDRLLAVATTDFGRHSLSLVYCFFDPAMHRYSLGTYSILKHIELARQTQRHFVYLGMYVSVNSHLSYKSRFMPQQRRRHGRWESFTSNQDDAVDGHVHRISPRANSTSKR